MALFNNSNKESSNATTAIKANTTIITVGAKIKGELELSCNIYIDGTIEGNVKSSQEINIGKNGKIQGIVVGDSIIVQGAIEGTVDAKRVEIKAEGRISGEVTANEFVIESKGVFEGTSVVKDLKPLNKPKVLKEK